MKNLAIAAVLMLCAISAPTSASAQAPSDAQCKAAYDSIFARLKTKSGQAQVSDAEISWALGYEKNKNAGKGCTRLPTAAPKAKTNTSAPVSVRKPTVPAATLKSEFDRGIAAYNSGNFKQAAEIFESTCGKGSGQGCFNTGMTFSKDRTGLPKNLAKSRDFYGRGCKLNYPEACQRYGWMTSLGEGGPQDKMAARAAHEKACSSGVAGSCTSAGASYVRLKAEGGYSGWDKALPYFEKGCSLKSGSSCYNIGLLFQKGLGGFAVDSVKARKHLGLACDFGYLESCNNFSAMVGSGQGGPKDTEQAMAILKGACDKKNGMACSNLAAHYANSMGGPYDPAKSMEYARLACKHDPKYCKK